MALPRELVQLVTDAAALNTTVRALNHVASIAGESRRATREASKTTATDALTSAILPDLTRAYNAAGGSRNELQQPVRHWPVAVKDVFCTTTEPTTASSRMLKDYISPIEATVVSRLRNAGALVVGKTNMDEFGMGSENVNSIFGSVVNPARPNGDTPRSAGGSSGGSAAAVAAGMCRVALGSDTGGSTRLPAAYCGVAGFKPSYGLLSRFGMIAYASSLDCVGILAKKVEDINVTHDTLSAHDPRDPTSVPQSVRDRVADRDRHLAHKDVHDLAGLKEYFPSELSPTVLPPLRKALGALKKRGAQIVSVSLPSTPLALGAYYVLASAEASSNLARYDGIRYGYRDIDREDSSARAQLYAKTRSKGFGKEVQNRILLGTFALSAEAFDNYFLQAQKVRHQIRQEFDEVFRQRSPLSDSVNSVHGGAGGVDVLLYPSAISTAPFLKQEATRSSSPSPSTSSYVQDLLNVPASLAGLPALHVPVGQSEQDGWPVGVQLCAQWGDDQLVLRVGRALQAAIE
ncbi:Trimeric GatFAB AmidoTransferase(AdT) complex subunit [Microbotryomycetes sp. JL201]|nr:Trimeric GatFAB AmidoTransferase(AdT) complex subunit [Microbotryomycetes sp. JL201]